jgi:hypothetical protein
MNSQTLKENGFSDPCPLKSVSFAILPFNQGSVFAIIDTSLTRKEATDILYIGRSKKPTRRILGEYLGGYGGKNAKRINSRLFEDSYIEKTAISWMLTDKPRAAQKELIDKYVQAHGESPLWNSSKKKQGKASKKAKPKAKAKPAVTAAAKTTKPKRPAKTAKPIAKASAAAKAPLPAKTPEPASTAQPSNSSAQKPLS